MRNYCRARALHKGVDYAYRVQDEGFGIDRQNVSATSVAKRDYLVYSRNQDENMPAADLPESYRMSIWQPGWLSLFPNGIAQSRYLVWWLFDRLGIFRPGYFKVVSILSPTGALVFRGASFPKWWRTPFMPAGDVQIGDLWTHPEFRNRTFARCGVFALVASPYPEVQRFWYICHRNNLASIALAKSCGFSVNHAARRAPDGIFGQYVDG